MLFKVTFESVKGFNTFKSNFAQLYNHTYLYNKIAKYMTGQLMFSRTFSLLGMKMLCIKSVPCYSNVERTICFR